MVAREQLQIIFIDNFSKPNRTFTIKLSIQVYLCHTLLFEIVLPVCKVEKSVLGYCAPGFPMST